MFDKRTIRLFIIIAFLGFVAGCNFEVVDSPADDATQEDEKDVGTTDETDIDETEGSLEDDTGETEETDDATNTADETEEGETVDEETIKSFVDAEIVQLGPDHEFAVLWQGEEVIFEEMNCQPSGTSTYLSNEGDLINVSMNLPLDEDHTFNIGLEVKDNKTGELLYMDTEKLDDLHITNEGEIVYGDVEVYVDSDFESDPERLQFYFNCNGIYY